VTTPQAPAAQNQSPPPSAAEQALVTAVASALLAEGLTSGAGLAAIMTGLAIPLAAVKLRSVAMRAALGMVLSHPPGQDGFWGDAGRQMARQNLLRRAQFTVSAAHRLSDDVSRAISAHQSIVTAISSGLDRERRFYGQHLVAIWGRQRAGAQVDSAAMLHGRMLGWHTVRDAKTSKECLAADGKNFYADHVPLIGYPGAVHPNCRCQPGAPFPHGAILPSYGLTLRRAA